MLPCAVSRVHAVWGNSTPCLLQQKSKRFGTLKHRAEHPTPPNNHGISSSGWPVLSATRLFLGWLSLHRQPAEEGGQKKLHRKGGHHPEPSFPYADWFVQPRKRASQASSKRSLREGGCLATFLKEKPSGGKPRRMSFQLEAKEGNDLVAPAPRIGARWRCP